MGKVEVALSEAHALSCFMQVSSQLSTQPLNCNAFHLQEAAIRKDVMPA
jgi:hypothetical protein